MTLSRPVTCVSALLACVAIAGCGGTKTTPDTDHWFAESPASQTADQVQTASTAEPGASPAAGSDEAPSVQVTAPPLDPKAVDAPFTLTRIDPCTLVTVDEWTAWAGSTDGKPIPLENGEACGFIGDGDHVRLALSVIAPDEAAQYLPIDTSKAVDVLAALNAPEVTRAMWAQNYPVGQSSSLVIEGPRLGLVIEMSGRSGWDDAKVREGALAFARIALGRIS